MKLFEGSQLLLKQQSELFARILNKKLSPPLIVELLLLGVVGLAVFGAVMSIVVPHWWFTGRLMWKMIVLIFGSNALCVPALYVFSSIRGSRITLPQLLLFVSSSVATTAVVLLSLSPISWFFAWATDNSLGVVRALNGLMIGFGMIFGIILLARAFQAGHKHYREHYPENKSAADILLLWLILVIVVTAQMSQKLGPWYYDGATKSCIGGWMDQICFPQEAHGEILEAPTIQNGLVTWAPGTTLLSGDRHELEYAQLGENEADWSGSTADCTEQTGKVICTVDLAVNDLEPGTYTMQVLGNRDLNERDYRSAAFTFEQIN